MRIEETTAKIAQRVNPKHLDWDIVASDYRTRASGLSKVAEELLHLAMRAQEQKLSVVPLELENSSQLESDTELPNVEPKFSKPQAGMPVRI